MVSRTKKTVLIHTMLILASLWSDATAQAFKKAAVPFTQPAFQQSAFQQPAFQQPAFQRSAFQQPAFQQPAFQGSAFAGHSAFSPAAKGYFSPQTAGGWGQYNSHPINGAYWTGHQPYPNYHYPQYSPYPYNHYPQYHPLGGFQQSAGHYPSFDPSYWSMNGGHAYPGHAYPGHAYYPYQGGAMYYPGQHMYNNRGYYPGGHPMYGHQPYPYYKKPFGAGFMGPHGHKIVKGILGATLVGIIAGKVARG